MEYWKGFYGRRNFWQMNRCTNFWESLFHQSEVFEFLDQMLGKATSEMDWKIGISENASDLKGEGAITIIIMAMVYCVLRRVLQTVRLKIAPTFVVAGKNFNPNGNYISLVPLKRPSLCLPLPVWATCSKYADSIERGDRYFLFALQYPDRKMEQRPVSCSKCRVLN